MKQLEFKQNILDLLSLLKANIKFSLQKDLAFAANNWASVFSSIFYTISILVFIDVLYSNINTLAGYSRNDMLFYFLIGQITYYLNRLTSLASLEELIPDINKGNLDMILIKPVPSYFYIMTRKINIIPFITTYFPPTLAIVLSIKWEQITFTPFVLLIGSIIFFSGLVVLHIFQLLAALPAFWLGESESIVDLAGYISGGASSMIPLEGYGPKLQFLFSTFIPILITTGFTTSVLLHKSNYLPLLLVSLTTMLAFIFIGKIFWRMAIRNYTSASS